MTEHVHFLGTDWRQVPTTDGSDLRVHHGPGPADTAALAGWLRRGCPGFAPISQGFVAVLVDRDGSVIAAGSSRLELALLYAVVDGRLLVATHPRDIACGLPAKPALNLQKLADLMALYDDPATTVFEGIDRLPIGHRLTWHRGWSRPQVSRWFRPLEMDPLRIKPAEAPALMRETVHEAVRASLPRSGDVAATLSGGLDSSMVVGTAASILAPQGRTVHCVTHRPLPGTPDPRPGWIADDGPDAEAMCREVDGTTWTGLRNDALATPFEIVQADFELSWSPSLNPMNAVWMTQAIDFATSVSSPVLLTGATGNGPFSRGRGGILRDLPLRDRFEAARRQVPVRARAGERLGRAALGVAKESAPLWAQRLRHAHRRGRVVDPRFQDLMPFGSLPPSAAAQARLAEMDAGLPPREAWLQLVLRDAFVAMVGQYRRPDVWFSDPLSDQRVSALALTLPVEAWFAGGRDRGLAREAAEGLVPDRIRLRTTRGAQSADAPQWRQGRRDDYRAEVERLRASASARSIVDLDEAATSLDKGFDSPTGSWEVTHGRALGLAAFALWWESKISPR
ncbi:MAG: asparagine synthase-related protein [Nocardioides sp.]|nr:asparagine synthase-related protein [Nocardioides sp.]